MKQLCWLIAMIFCTINTFAQTDTVLHSVLSELRVVGYDSDRRLLETPGAVSKISSKELNMFQSDNILYGLNLSPGVRMEERSPGSYRIAIRGSSLRSPFGVRNVKVYWNGIPFTDPTGSTAFNLLDPVNISEIDLIRGPAGSIYGAGNGGVLQIKSRLDMDSLTYVEANAGLGSYGYQKWALKWNQKIKNGVINTKIARQSSDGYREHSSLERNTVEINAGLRPSQSRKIGLHFLFSDLAYDIPGGLDIEQYQEDRRQARPGNPFVLGSVDAKSGIDQQYMLLGFQQQYMWKNSWQNHTLIYGDLSRFNNPFNLDYKRELRTGYGIRSRQDYFTNIAGKPIKFSVGTEFQQGYTVARNFENDLGQAGDLNFDDEINSFQWLVFARTELELSDDMFVTLGISQNQLEYDINRLVDRSLDSAYRVNKTFEPVYVPRLGWSMQLNEWALHASVSYGFSPPTIEEIRTNEGSINEALEAERGSNFELGLRKFFIQDRLYVDATAFYYLLDETIVQQQSERGTVLFLNAGSTEQTGIELQTKYKVINSAMTFVEGWDLGMNYTFHHFKFKDYLKFENGEDQDYSGNTLPGVSPNNFTFYSITNFKGNWYFNASYQYVDGIYLDDANTVQTDSFDDVKLKAGWRFNLPGIRAGEFYIGVNNLFDQAYSLGNDLNAFGGRYYQPAPGINYYGGVVIRI
ncbi:TonB-dependent receptor [Membranihabitans marinus]|uniref:TonB-dependent receptor n=1 Tax=Membranihabitans marinus TaxID=1227546 RepID=UPI001F2A850E|nr:TonB-dependent receptor plug domain-containing protein [Membranihabitans marinus]